jgi:hypothetical protein
MFMESLCSSLLKPSKANEHGSAFRGLARLQETSIGAVRIMVRSGAVDATLRRVKQGES